MSFQVFAFLTLRFVVFVLISKTPLYTPYIAGIPINKINGVGYKASCWQYVTNSVFWDSGGYNVYLRTWKIYSQTIIFLSSLGIIIKGQIQMNCSTAMCDKRLLHSELHWLDVPERVQYKIGIVMHSCLHGQAPRYFTDLCVPVFRRLSTAASSIRYSAFFRGSAMPAQHVTLQLSTRQLERSVFWQGQYQTSAEDAFIYTVRTVSH